MFMTKQDIMINFESSRTRFTGQLKWHKTMTNLPPAIKKSSLDACYALITLARTIIEF